MSQKRERRPKKPREARSKRNASDKNEKTLSSSLRQADGRLPNAMAVSPTSHDIIFIESGHFLTRKTRNRLGLIRAILGIESGSHAFGDDVPVLIRISYNELSELILEQLTEREIPVMEERPFLFHYELFGKYLPKQVRINEFYNAFIELMLNEWKIMYARKLFVGFGFEEWGRRLPTLTAYEPLQNVAAQNGGSLAQTGFSLKTARGLWFASECIIRICAQWDKLIDNLVFDAYFSQHPTRRFNPTIDKLETYQDHQYLETTHQKDCLRALVSLARQTERLRSWRANDVHQFSETVVGVLEKTGTSQSLGTLWDMVVEEHNRAREATMAMIGMVVLGPETASLYYHAARLPSPTCYVDFDDPHIVAKHSQLVGAAQRKIELQKALKETGLSEQKAHHEQEILAADSEIKRLLYNLYGPSGVKDEL